VMALPMTEHGAERRSSASLPRNSCAIAATDA